MDAYAESLLKQVDGGKMNNLAYDTAWLARLGDIDSELSCRAMDWICENQLPDGSWGAEAPFYLHDRIISTLAVMIALTHKGRRTRDKLQVEKGLIALEKITGGAAAGASLANPNSMTVGFEMIVPTLVAEAERIGILKQRTERILGKLSTQRKEKLALLKDRKVSRHMTAAFSAEMAGLDGLSMLDVENLPEQNGSIGHSPSASAYFALQVKSGDERALNYLRTVTLNGGAPDLIPFDVFEATWVLWNLSLCSGWKIETKKLFSPLVEFLHKFWKPGKGIGLSIGYSIPDGDDTAIVFDILSKFDRAPDIEALLSFEKEHHFRTYHYEANRSASVNIHALGALLRAGLPVDHPKIQKIILHLRKIIYPGNYWVDKWNLSPYYPTSHAIITCAGHANFLIEKSVDWIISTQNPGGGWGPEDPTAEETAYALQSLCAWRKKGGKVSSEVIDKGVKWLEQRIEPPYPPLWIGKGLYCAENVVRSAIISALQMTRENLSL
jgi:halimadienyl-diphosphate synthase